MKIKLFEKDITDDRFYLMVIDSLDAYIQKDEIFTEKLAQEYAESLREEICIIIDEATADWIDENTMEEEE